MSIVGYGEIAKAVANTLRATTGVKRVEDYTQLGETIADSPCLQVYPTGGNVDAGDGETDRTTFSAGVRQTEMTVIVDGYARMRSNLREDIKAQVALADAVDAQLVMTTAPLFGIPAIKAMRWAWEAIEFKYGGGDTAPVYSGVRFTLTLTVY